jgi:hypothetical protein
VANETGVAGGFAEKTKMKIKKTAGYESSPFWLKNSFV